MGFLVSSQTSSGAGIGSKPENRPPKPVVCFRSNFNTAKDGAEEQSRAGAEALVHKWFRPTGRYAHRMKRECRHGRLNKLKQGGQANCPVGEHDLKLAEDRVPVLTPGMPVLDNHWESR